VKKKLLLIGAGILAALGAARVIAEFRKDRQPWTTRSNND
jgi:hypothetical protein